MITATLLAALIVIVLITPPHPRIADLQQFERGENQAWAASHDCQPDQIAKAASPIKKRARADKCQQDAEHYRQEKEGRWQAVRAAQAAEETAVLIWRQDIIGAVNTGILIVALAASFWAAFSAMQGAETAEDTLEHARKSAERGLRAYVFIEDAKIRPPSAGRPDWEVEYTVKNNGQTPAHKVKTWVSVRVLDWEPAALPEPATSDNLGSLAPGGDFVEADGGSPSDPVDMGKLEAKEQSIYLIGRIEYLDVFKNSQMTWFCFYVHPPIQQGWQQMHAHNEGNDST